jgi:hypothetical protein
LPELSSDLNSVLKRLIGRRCIGFTAGETTGSVVDLEFEPRRLRRRPLRNPHLTMEQQLGDPEYALLVECVWRLDSKEEIICGAWDNNELNGSMMRGLRQLVGQELESFVLSEPSYDLILLFKDGFVFKIFCDQVRTDHEEDNYSVFFPEGVIIIGPRSTLRQEERGEP